MCPPVGPCSKAPRTLLTCPAPSIGALANRTDIEQQRRQARHDQPEFASAPGPAQASHGLQFRPVIQRHWGNRAGSRRTRSTRDRHQSRWVFGCPEQYRESGLSNLDPRAEREHADQQSRVGCRDRTQSRAAAAAGHTTQFDGTANRCGHHAHSRSGSQCGTTTGGGGRSP